MAEKKGAPEGEQPKSKKKLFILIGAAVLVLALGGGAGFYFMKGSSPKKAEAAAEGGEKEGEAAKAEGEEATEMAEGGGEGTPGVGPMVNIEAFVINVIDDQDSRYLKAALTLEVDSPKTAEQVNARMPQVRDAILLLVGNKTYSELRDLQGKLQLRAELTAKLNTLLKEGQVKKIYFTDFVVQ